MLTSRDAPVRVSGVQQPGKSFLGTIQGPSPAWSLSGRGS